MEKKNRNAQTLRIWWNHTRVYWPMLIVCSVGVISLICCDIGMPILYKKLTDLLTSLTTNLVHRSEIKPPREIYTLVVLIVSVNLGELIGWRLCGFSIAIFESKIMADLNNTCFKYIHGHSFRFFSDNFAGSLLKRINRFSTSFEIIADQFVLQLGQVILRILLVIGVIFWRNSKLGLVFLAWTLILATFNIFVGRYKLKYDLYRAEMDTQVTARLADTISNSINIKLFASTDRETLAFAKLTDELRKARYAAWLFHEYSSAIQGFSTRVLQFAVLWLAIGYWWQGLLTIGDFVLLTSYLKELVGRVQDIGKCVQRIYEAMADANEMTEILVLPHEIRDLETAQKLKSSKGEISFCNVNFCYPGNQREIIQNFSLKTKPGERIGIVGHSGGGKSTILKLLVRLYDIQTGTIAIDGQNIREITQDSLHRNIAYVPQDPTLFHRTLMENIRYSRPDATDAEVVEAAQLAHCHEFISSFPLRYNTLVGERGVKLSGGERQRVAIARAILMNAPILVLDEATSSLDSLSENFIQDSLSHLMKGRTVIAVAHRLATIRKMDRIIVIDDGDIAEEGSHDELLEIENGVYQKLHSLQTLSSTDTNHDSPKYIE
jgi:ATP-binding cassette subfamily B protein